MPDTSFNDLAAGSRCVMPDDFFDSLDKALFEDGIKGAEASSNIADYICIYT